MYDFTIGLQEEHQQDGGPPVHSVMTGQDLSYLCSITESNSIVLSASKGQPRITAAPEQQVAVQKCTRQARATLTKQP
jgi:hypothetical protein